MGVSKQSTHVLVGYFDLEGIPGIQAEIEIHGSHIYDWGQGGFPPVKTEFNGSQPKDNPLIERLVRFHGTHGAKTGITASLGMDMERR